MLVPMTPPPTITTFVSAGRELDAIVSFVNVSGVAPGVFPIPTAFRETIRTEAADVFGRFFLEERFDEETADACGAADAMGVAAAGHHETFQARTFADDKAAVWRKRWPAFANASFVSAASFWKKACELFFERIQNEPIRLDWRWFGTRFVGARIGLHRFGFPTAKEKSAFSRTAIQRHFRNAETGKVWRHAFHGDGDEIFVADGNDR